MGLSTTGDPRWTRATPTIHTAAIPWQIDAARCQGPAGDRSRAPGRARTPVPAGRVVRSAAVSDENQKRLIALMIGLTTVCAGLFTWRAAQIGSAAAFDDRQSVGETIKVEQQNVNVAVEAVRQANQYNLYLADYAAAAELDAQAVEVAAAGDNTEAKDLAAAADSTRATASLRAARAGVFGLNVLGANLEEPGPEPQPFDLEDRIEELSTEQATTLLSPGDLDPDRWADEANDIRSRIRTFSVWVLILLGAVALFTTAELTVSRRLRIGAAAAGLLILVAAAVSGTAQAWS